MINDSDLPPLTELPAERFELNRWLYVATADLCDDAKARVRKEVESHFNAAYEEGRREGLIDAAARAWAITALGHAMSARNEFNKLYLTTRDIQRLKTINGNWIYKLAATVVLGFAAFLLWLYFTFMPISGWSLRANFLAGYFVLMAFQLVIAAFFGKRCPRIALTSVMIAVPMVCGMFVINLPWSLRELGPSNFSPPVTSFLTWTVSIAAIGVWLLMAVESISTHLPIMRKLGDKRNRDAAFPETKRPK